MHYMRNWNRDYLDFAKEKGWRQKNDPVQLAIVFRHAAKLSPGRARQDQRAVSRPTICASASETYFDPLPFLVRAAGRERRYRPEGQLPLNAITQRPMAMYHSGTRKTPGCGRSTATTTCT